MSERREVNRHGLSRTISRPVKRQIRQQCGFGCVICGNAICHYEHVDPPFAEAREHDPEKMTLLCGSCHGKVTTGMLSKQTVKQAVASPKCKQLGFSFEAFDIGAVQPVVSIPGYRFVQTPILIEICGTPLISFKPPECEGGPFRLSALFCDKSGQKLLEIVDNEWKAVSTTWDVEVVGRKIYCRFAQGDISLILQSDPPNTLTVERLAMVYKGSQISINDTKDLLIVSHTGATIHAEWGALITIEKQRVGFRIDENGNLFVGSS